MDGAKSDKVKRYHTQRNMNKEIYFYGLTGIQTIGVFMLLFVLFMVVGNLGPALFLILVPVIQLNKKKLSQGDPNYFDTLRVKIQTKRHYQDMDGVMRKLVGRKGDGE